METLIDKCAACDRRAVLKDYRGNGWSGWVCAVHASMIDITFFSSKSRWIKKQMQKSKEGN